MTLRRREGPARADIPSLAKWDECELELNREDPFFWNRIRVSCVSTLIAENAVLLMARCGTFVARQPGRSIPPARQFMLNDSVTWEAERERATRIELAFSAWETGRDLLVTRKHLL